MIVPLDLGIGHEAKSHACQAFKKEVPVDEKIRLVSLHFSFKNFSAIPKWVRYRHGIIHPVRTGEKGTMLFPATTGCSTLELLGELEKEGFFLVDAFSTKKAGGKHTVHFRFVKEGKVLPGAAAALAEVGKFLWTARGFLNPLHLKGQAVEGQRMISVDLNGRQSLPITAATYRLGVLNDVLGLIKAE